MCVSIFIQSHSKSDILNWIQECKLLTRECNLNVRQLCDGDRIKVRDIKFMIQTESMIKFEF